MRPALSSHQARVATLLVSGLLICGLQPAEAQFTQQGSKLVGTGAAGAAGQGASVAISADGNVAILGGPGDNNMPAPRGGDNGAAWVFTQSGGVWMQQGPKLVGSGAGFVIGAGQGSSVALSADGSTAILGAPSDDGILVGTLILPGASWVFTSSGGVWTQQGSKLFGSGADAFPFSIGQGASVALSADGNTAVVGGPNDTAYAGATWVFTRGGGVWTQQGSKLVGNGGIVSGGNSTSPGQGRSVALSGDGNTLIVGDTSDNNNIGAVWVFTRTGSVWTQQGGKLVGTGAVGLAQQGISVALSGDGNTAIVGGYQDNSGAGAVWIFTRSGGVWSQQGSKLVGTGAVGLSVQGYSVALSTDGNIAIVGGYQDNAGAGAAWVFTRTGGVWAQLGSKLVGTGAVGTSAQGASVALSGDGRYAIVGGPQDNANTGAAWVFATAPSPLLAAVLPESRSAQPGGVVTAFATIINTGATTLPGCFIAPAVGLPAAFAYRPTDPKTNAVIGTLNTPISIAGNGGSQSFVIGLTPSAAIGPTNVGLTFSCTNTTPAPIVIGLNTLLLSASTTTPTPDIIALGATVQNDGIVHVTGTPMSGAFAVATDNLGSGDTITVAASATPATLPLTITLCQSNPTTGVCLQSPTATVAASIGANSTPTFVIFVSASGTVPLDPANSRIFVTFTDSGNVVRGETSVAVETQ
jgi:hypothetical protein